MKDFCAFDNTISILDEFGCHVPQDQCREPVQQEFTMSSDTEESDMSRLSTHVDFRKVSDQELFR